MKVTQEQIDARIKDVRFAYDGTLTICVIELDNGWKATGESACVDPAEYNRDLGETLARSNAMCKVWSSMGFALAENIHSDKQPAKVDTRIDAIVVAELEEGRYAVQVPPGAKLQLGHELRKTGGARSISVKDGSSPLSGVAHYGDDHGAEIHESQRFGVHAKQGSFEASLMSPNAKSIEAAA